MTTPAGYPRIRAWSGGAWKASSLGTFPGAKQDSGYVAEYPQPTETKPNGRFTGAFGHAEFVWRFPDGLSATDYNNILSVYGGVSADTPDVEIEIELLDPRGSPLPAWETWRGYAAWPTLKTVLAGLIYNGVEIKTRLVERT